MFCPDSKVHMANMGPTWVLSAPGGPHVGPVNLAIWVVIAQWLPRSISICLWINWVPNNKLIIINVCSDYASFVLYHRYWMHSPGACHQIVSKSHTWKKKKTLFKSPWNKCNWYVIDYNLSLNNFIMVRVSYDSWLQTWTVYIWIGQARERKTYVKLNNDYIFVTCSGILYHIKATGNMNIALYIVKYKNVAG